MTSTDLRTLAVPFPQQLVRSKPGTGAAYVEHALITQRLLAVIGPFGMTVVREIRGHAPAETLGKGTARERTVGPFDDVVVGVILRCEFVIDGRTVIVEEAGDCEHPAQRDNDGFRAKLAISDALKRCASRVGCGLHLWGKGAYVLDKMLDDVAGGVDLATGERESKAVLNDDARDPDEPAAGPPAAAASPPAPAAAPAAGPAASGTNGGAGLARHQHELRTLIAALDPAKVQTLQRWWGDRGMPVDADGPAWSKLTEEQAQEARATIAKIAPPAAVSADDVPF